MAARRPPRSIAEAAVHEQQAPARRLFTVDEYYKMAEVGILRPDERVQLIEGELIEMPAIRPRHAYNVGRIARLLIQRLGVTIDVRVQNPIRLDNGAEPEPDVAVVRLDPANPRRYESRHPDVEDTLLIVEVADSTLAFDLGVKAAMYARHGITDLWVVDLQGDAVVVHREPTADGYVTVQTCERGTTISLLAFPDITFTADAILG